MSHFHQSSEEGIFSQTSLFSSFTQHLVALFFLSLLFSFSLLMAYKDYKTLSQFDDYITKAVIVDQYKKDNSWVMRVRSEEGFTFFTSSREDLIDLRGYEVNIRLFKSDSIGFLEYLSGFYLPSIILERSKEKIHRYQLKEKIESLHDTHTSIYAALFLATPISKEQRDQLSYLGINHLLAISGFHLGVLFFVLFFLLRSGYRPIAQYFFPFRHTHRDISILVLSLLFFYVWFLDFPASLIRAYVMTLFAYILYDRGIKILSFSFLFYCVLLLVALWPNLLFNIGFLFSVCGVYFIYLYLHHVKELRAYQHFVLLHLWIFLAMLPVVHFFFETFTFYQLFSPLLTMVFILFYPIEIGLHFLGFTKEFDFILGYLLALKIQGYSITLPWYVLGGNLLLSIAAIFHRYLFFLLVTFDLALLVYFFYGIA